MLKIAISGSSGLIGSRLVTSLTQRGDQVLGLVRRKPVSSQEIHWDPKAGSIEVEKLEGLDALVHLAGDPIAAGRWTPEKKARIRDSRVQGTKLVAEAMTQLQQPPQVLVCASAVGIYGDRGEEFLTEESPPGTGFLAAVGQAWEAATRPAAQKGIRVVNLRFGMVLAPEGGALKMMLPPFRMGLGGALGNGRQFMSWVSIKDVIRVIEFVIESTSLSGSVNAVAPETVTNLQFSKTLGKVLNRPVLFPVPAVMVRLLFGEMADEALLASTRVVPKRLQEFGFRFEHPELEEALRDLLKQK